MAVPSLLLPAHLPKRTPRLWNQEDRVVAETGDPPPLGNDLPTALTLEEFRQPAGHRQRDGADEPREPRARVSLQAIQQHLPALLLCCPNASPSHTSAPLPHL